MKKLLNIALFMLMTVSFFGQSNWKWKYSTPEEHKANSTSINKVLNSLSKDVHSCVVIRDGVIISEFFNTGYNNKSVFSLQSVSKSITGALVGIAIDQGLIGSENDYAADYLPELKNAKYKNMKLITIKQLLNNTSGLIGTDSKIWNEWRTSENWIDYILSRPMTANPGAYFEYSTGNSHILGAILEKVTGKTLEEYAKEQIFDKIGITSAYLDTDPQGIGDGGNGFHMTAYDMARFGLLFLNDGVWEGQQVVPKRWVKESTSLKSRRPSTGSRYGYQWWLKNYGKAGYLGYNAQGFGGQYIFVVPQLDLIVVFTSSRTGSITPYFENVDKIVNACTR